MMKRALWLSFLTIGGMAVQSVGTAGSPQAGSRTEQMTDGVRPPSADASWLVLEGCIDDPRLDPDADQDFKQAWPRMQQCGEAARTIVQTGTDADRERLWTVFDELPERSQLAVDVVDAFLDWHLERVLAALEDSRAPAASEPLAAEVEIPGFLRDAPAELQLAWRLHQTVVQTGQKARERRSTNETIAFQSNQPAFRRTAAGFLRGRVSAAETVQELSRYVWAGWCGTGSGMLDTPQSKALLIAHLQLGRVHLALADSGGLDAPVLASPEQTTRWDRRLLAAAGIDWELFYLGGVLSGRADLANTLARRGSERTARQLLQAARILAASSDRESNGVSDSLLWPLAALVEPGDACMPDGGWDSREVRRDREAEPISGDVQADILDLLAEKVGAGAGLDEAEAASHLLVQLCRPESRPAFRAMLRSPYEEVRMKGAIGLRALGETVADPQPSEAVAFRIVVDGKPLVQGKVEQTLRRGEWDELSSTESDEHGVVRLARDPFLDPRRRC